MNLTPKVEHTPTPWTLSGDADGYIYGQGGHIVVNPYKPLKDLPNAEANAAFIVRAVNEYDSLKAENAKLKDSHEELISAIKAMREYVAEAYQTKGQTLLGILDEADKAIAKAEGK